MCAPPASQGSTRRATAVLWIALLSSWAPGCSLTMDASTDQCRTDEDCAALGDAICDRELDVCVPRDVSNCSTLAAPPPPPEVVDAGSTFTFNVAVNAMHWGDEDDPPSHASIGYDVDGLCTTPRSDVACRAPGWAGGDVVDGPGGRDNGIGRLVAEQSNFIGIPIVTSAGINENMRTGRERPILILRIIGFSGKPDDDALTVELYDAAERTTGGDMPAWDGTDGWAVTWDSVAGSAEGPWPWLARAVTHDAYVNDYTLVARFDETVTVNFLGVPTPVHDSLVTAKLVQDPVDRWWSLQNGVVAGSIESRVFLSLIPGLAKAFVGVEDFCMDDPQYKDLKRMFCAFVDLPAPGAGPDQPCAFISFAAGATALPVQLTGVADEPFFPPVCPAETDPVRDSCEAP